MHIDTD